MKWERWSFGYHDWGKLRYWGDFEMGWGWGSGAVVCRDETF